MPEAWCNLLALGAGSRACLFAVCPLLLPLLPDGYYGDKGPSALVPELILGIRLSHPDRLMRWCCHQAENGNPCPELLLWR